jgi:hypothetical protein
VAGADPVGGHAQQAWRLGSFDLGRADAQLSGGAEHAGPIAGDICGGEQELRQGQRVAAGHLQDPRADISVEPGAAAIEKPAPPPVRRRAGARRT